VREQLCRLGAVLTAAVTAATTFALAIVGAVNYGQNRELVEVADRVAKA
jgi:hypothetical protein